MKNQYSIPTITVEKIVVEDVILVSTIDENQDIKSTPYDDNF